MESQVKPFYGVMYKYEKHFSEHGVKANLDRWFDNKYGLIALLRNHPDWNEEALAILFQFTESRGIVRSVVNQHRNALAAITSNMQMTRDERNDFQTALNAATDEYSESLSEGSAEIIMHRSGVRCVAGQKTTRVIGKLCQKYGVDKQTRYNSVSTQLFDALSPKETRKKGLLSVHPCDFLEMSNKDNNWSSCHNLRDGGYQSGCLSYMNDSTTMIFYTVDDNVTDNYRMAPKRNRQVFCYAEGMLLQSRLYPNIDDEDAKKQYRFMVQGAIASCLGVPDRWTLRKNTNERREFYKTADGSRQYPDYSSYGIVTTLKGLDAQGHIVIGEHAYCVCCGQSLRNGSVKCNCEDKVVCQDCGQTVPAGNARYSDGVWLCNACLHICARCGASVRDGAMFPAFDRRGNEVQICEACNQSIAESCASCSVQAVCPSAQSGRFCQRIAIAA